MQKLPRIGDAVRADVERLQRTELLGAAQATQNVAAQIKPPANLRRHAAVAVPKVGRGALPAALVRFSTYSKRADVVD